VNIKIKPFSDFQAVEEAEKVFRRTDAEWREWRM